MEDGWISRITGLISIPRNYGLTGGEPNFTMELHEINMISPLVVYFTNGIHIMLCLQVKSKA